jgi:tetratricopeptide (TPR) repeat protein
MSLGYNAQQECRHYEAAQYFRSALYLSPDDRSAVVAYWNARDALQNGDSAAQTFDELMNRGYDATQAGDYQTALEYFQQAAALRPGDYYASQAIRHVRTYFNSEAVAGNPAESVTTTSPEVQFPAVARQSDPGEAPYDPRYMRLGYASLQEQAFITAAEYFRSALYERPNDRSRQFLTWLSSGCMMTIVGLHVPYGFSRFRW